MASNRLVWLLVVVMALLMTSCGPQETAAPAAAPQTTPIDQATVGEVTGKVLFEGSRPAPKRIFMNKDPWCASSHSEAIYAEDGKVNDDGSLPNAFVYVKEGAEKYSVAVPSDSVSLDQKGCLFEPHVLGIMVGQELQVASSDPTTHNVHAVPKANREWNLTQAPGGAPFTKKFAHPEIMVPVSCKQHPWMKAYVGVTRNPFYAVTGGDGSFTVKGLPAGDYTIEAWTATFGTQQQKITVRAKETTTANFTFRAP